MGIDSKVSVFFIKAGVQTYEDKYAEGNSIYICFQPGDLNMGELVYQTRVSTTEDTSGISGRINAYKTITKPVNSIEELIAFLNAQVKTNGAN
jgi:hypothetical protein